MGTCVILLLVMMKNRQKRLKDRSFLFLCPVGEYSSSWEEDMTQEHEAIGHSAPTVRKRGEMKAGVRVILTPFLSGLKPQPLGLKLSTFRVVLASVKLLWKHPHSPA